jgi:hypothetical protein
MFRRVDVPIGGGRGVFLLGSETVVRHVYTARVDTKLNTML